jgi:hypothetical protein
VDTTDDVPDDTYGFTSLREAILVANSKTLGDQFNIRLKSSKGPCDANGAPAATVDGRLAGGVRTRAIWK